MLRREDELDVLFDATPEAAITVLDNDETCLELKNWSLLKQYLINYLTLTMKMLKIEPEES